MLMVGRVLRKGEMSHSHCTEILTCFSLNPVPGNKDKFDPKRRKIRNVLEKGTMFGR